MSEKFLPYGHQSINEDDINAVVNVLRGDWLTMGPAVEDFERSVADYVGAAFAVSFSSGTSALHGAMNAAGVACGDAVIVPPLTFAATSNSVLYCGGTPLFADISPDTLCLDPNAAKSVCDASSMPVKAIAPVSFAGYPVDMDAFRDLADETGAVIIEDACHALGAERGSRRIGQEADMTVFSFHPVKHITTAEGGMVVTDSEKHAKSLRLFRSHGITKDARDFVRPYEGPWDNDMLELGYNYRLSDIASALGASQMKRLDSFVARRREIAALYMREIAGLDGVVLPPNHPGHSWHLFPIQVSAEKRREIFDTFRAAGIGVQVHYVPVHLHTYYRENLSCSEGEFPHSEDFSARGISLPIFPDMADDDVLRVVKVLRGAL